MFDSKFYKQKFVCKYHDKYALLELNIPRKEAYILYKAEDDKLEIRLRDLTKGYLPELENMIPLSSFLMQNGYNDKNFSNPFTRTYSIVSALDNISKEKVKTKKINK